MPLGSAGAAVEARFSPHLAPKHHWLEVDQILVGCPLLVVSRVVGLVAQRLRCQLHGTGLDQPSDPVWLSLTARLRCWQQLLVVNSDQKLA